MTENDLQIEHAKYFQQFVDNRDIHDDSDIISKLSDRLGTHRRAMTIYKTWCQIKSYGVAHTIATMSKSTWHRHKRELMAIGISWVDMNTQQIQPIRVITFDLTKPVISFDQIAA